jgi:ribosomal protein L11 methyltransferase
MFLWRKSASRGWVEVHADILQMAAQGALVIVKRPRHKLFQLEIACSARAGSRALLEQFGGRVEQFPRNWLERFIDTSKAKSIKIGKRLIVAESVNGRPGYNRPGHQLNPLRRARPDAPWTAHATAKFLLIPASMAFGTGEHATTTMALRFLEKLTRRWRRGWSLVDFGTGSGILALAAKRFGAGRVVGVDIDPTAISTAKLNARLNKIRGTAFQVADARKWKQAQKTHVITANLYSDLLIEILPNLKHGCWLILSGILRSQQTEFLCVLLRSKVEIISIKRRGKWIAILAHWSDALRVPEFAGGKVLRRSPTAATVKNQCKLNSLPTSSSRRIRCENLAPGASLGG